MTQLGPSEKLNKDDVGSAHNGLADQGLDHFESLDSKGMGVDSEYHPWGLIVWITLVTPRRQSLYYVSWPKDTTLIS